MHKSVLLLALLVALCVCHPWCGHEKALKYEKKANRRTSFKTPVTRSAVQTTFQPIRITFDTSALDNDPNRICKSVGQSYTRGNPSSPAPACQTDSQSDCVGSCTAEQVADSAKITKIKTVTIPQTKAVLEGLLSVRRLTGNLVMSSQQSICGSEGGVQIPASYKNPGVANTDLLIFVTMRPTDSGTLAWAIECSNDGTSSQPRAGQVNINPTSLSNPAITDDQFNGILLHEITHILGFSSNKYTQFVAADGVTKLSNVVSSFSRTLKMESKTIQKIVTSRVAETTRLHFGCSSADGLELEENGGSGTAGSHWEKRLVVNDFMIGAASWFNPSDNWTISTFSLALLEDSGWYKPDYTKAGKLNWGRNTGCSMLTQPCESWGLGAYEGYFCSETNNQIGHCTYELTGKGYCGISTYNAALPGYYQHLAQTNKGGSDPNMDYCPVINRYSNGNCRAAAAATTYEYFGTNAACFDSSVGAAAQSTPKGAACYEYRCATSGANSTTLQVRISSTWYDCGNDNQEKRISNLNSLAGYVRCAKDAYRILCTNQAGVQPTGTIDNGSGTGSGTKNCLVGNFFCSSAVSQTFNFVVLLVALLAALLL